MVLKLTPEYESKLAKLVSSGEFESEVDAAQQAIDLLTRERQRLRLVKLLEDAAVEAEVHGTVEATPELYRQVKERARARIAAGIHLDNDSDVWPVDDD